MRKRLDYFSDLEIPVGIPLYNNFVGQTFLCSWWGVSRQVRNIRACFPAIGCSVGFRGSNGGSVMYVKVQVQLSRIWKVVSQIQYVNHAD